MGSTFSKVRGRKRIALTITKKSRSTRASPTTEHSSPPEAITLTEAQLASKVYSQNNYHTCRPVRREYRYSQETWRTVGTCDEYCAYADQESYYDEEEPRDHDLVTEEETVREGEIVDHGEVPEAQAVASEEAPTLVNFHKFSDLAPEIRLKIWKVVCLEPRMVDVWQVEKDINMPYPHCGTFQYKSHCPIPAVLHISHESRYEGLKYYTLGFGREAERWTVDQGVYREFRPIQLPPRIYFNPQCDMICPIPEEEFTYEPWNYGSNLDQMLSDISKDTPSITKIAIEHSEGFFCHPGFFSNLREINMYRTSGLPLRFNPNMRLNLKLKLLDFEYWESMEIWWNNGDGTADKILADKLPVKSDSGERKTGEDEMEARFRADVKFRKTFLEVDWEWGSGISQFTRARPYRPLL